MFSPTFNEDGQQEVGPSDNNSPQTPIKLSHNVVVHLPVDADADDVIEQILTPNALSFLEQLHQTFSGRRADLLAARQLNRQWIEMGNNPRFREDTVGIRQDPNWKVAAPAPGLVDRRVEIHGPTQRKMAINALNSGANVWLADFEDSNTPHFGNVFGGQLNLFEAIRGTIEYTSSAGRHYVLGENIATVGIRPRGLHLTEKHLTVNGYPMSASLVDFGLYLYHNGRELVQRGIGPYFYLPKVENSEEARFWNDVFLFAQKEVGLDQGTIRATVLIETITAAFEMEEILYELREHSAGLNAGRWDYIFSIVKNFRARGQEFVLPDRSNVTMDVPFMRAYTDLLVQTCHRRGAHAIGGVSSVIPTKKPERDREVREQITQEKTREAQQGFDGAWVAHPFFVEPVRDVFTKAFNGKPHQIDNLRDDVSVAAEDLLDVASTKGEITEDGLRKNINIALRYLISWFGGRGAVPMYGVSEDAATVEISRSQIWQWIHSESKFDTGQVISRGLVRHIVAEEAGLIRIELASDPVKMEHYWQAKEIFEQVCLGEEFPTFLTIPAYARYIP